MPCLGLLDYFSLKNKQLFAVRANQITKLDIVACNAPVARMFGPTWPVVRHLDIPYSGQLYLCFVSLNHPDIGAIGSSHNTAYPTANATITIIKVIALITHHITAPLALPDF